MTEHQIEASELDPSVIMLNYAQADRANAEQYKLVAETKVARLHAARERITVTRMLLDKRFSDASDIHNRVYRFDDAFTQPSCNECHEYLSRWARQDITKPVEIQMTSGGGDVWHGMALVDQMLALRERGLHIKGVVRGTAASMAAVWLQACSERVMGPSSTILMHKLSAGFDGTLDQLEDYTTWLKIMQEQANAMIADRSNLSLAQVKAGMNRKDWAMGPDEALSKGLIDSIG